MLLKIPGAPDLLEALLSYTQRHFVRMDRLVRSTFLLDYTLASMNVLMPDVGTDSAELPDFQQLDQPGTDVDTSTGTDVDADVFMQPAVNVLAADDDDEDVQAVAGKQQAASESLSQQQDEGEVQEEGQGAQEMQQPAPQKAKVSKASKRRKSAPQPVQQDSVAQKAGSQTAVKVKRKKVA